MTARWQIGTIRGIPVGLHWSMALVLTFLTISLATSLFPDTHPSVAGSAAWVMAAITSVLFCASILLHELGHASEAQRQGMQVRGVTLFLLGGVAQVADRPRSAVTELRVAVAGPIVSVALAGAFGLVWLLGRDVASIAAPAAWLARLNLVLAVFNLLPGFPLDGGRILRALIWQVTGDERRSAQAALISGQIVAFGLMGLGVLLVVGGTVGNGLWLIFLGWFLQNAAVGEAAGTTLGSTLRGLTVGQAMGPQVPSRITIRQLIDDHVLPTGHRYFLVVDGEVPRGVVTLSDVRQVPRERWDWTSVREVMTPWSDLAVVTSDTTLLAALELMDEVHIGHVPVVDSGRLRGLLTREEVLHQLRLRTELGV